MVTTARLPRLSVMILLLASQVRPQRRGSQDEERSKPNKWYAPPKVSWQPLMDAAFTKSLRANDRLSAQHVDIDCDGKDSDSDGCSRSLSAASVGDLLRRLSVGTSTSGSCSRHSRRSQSLSKQKRMRSLPGACFTVMAAVTALIACVCCAQRRRTARLSRLPSKFQKASVDSSCFFGKKSRACGTH